MTRHQLQLLQLGILLVFTGVIVIFINLLTAAAKEKDKGNFKFSVVGFLGFIPFGFGNDKKSDGNLSGDGTGLETSRKQNYESSKKYSHYMTCIVDSREVVQAFDVSGTQECQAMHDLIKNVEGKSLRLDAGFIDRKLVNEIAAKGIVPYIFPKGNLNLNGHPAWKEMYMELYLDVMQWLTEYHQRSHSESFNSSFKRRNKLVSKIRSMCQLSQITARIIIHNFRRLSYFNKLADAS